MTDDELALIILRTTGHVVQRSGKSSGLTVVGTDVSLDRATRMALGHANRPQLLATVYRILKSAQPPP